MYNILGIIYIIFFKYLRERFRYWIYLSSDKPEGGKPYQMDLREFYYFKLYKNYKFDSGLLRIWNLEFRFPLLNKMLELTWRTVYLDLEKVKLLEVL